MVTVSSYNDTLLIYICIHFKRNQDSALKHRK